MDRRTHYQPMAAFVAKTEGPIDVNRLGWAQYRHPKEGFVLERPDGWTIQEAFMGALVAVLEPQANWTQGFASNVNVVLALVEGDLEAYAKKQVDALSTLLSDLRVIDLSIGRVDSFPGARITATYREGSHHMTLEQQHVVQGGRAYVVSATALSERYEALAPTFERILDSFRPSVA